MLAHVAQRTLTQAALRAGEAAVAALATAAALAVAAAPRAYLFGQAIGPAVLVGVISLRAPWPTWRLLRADGSSHGFREKVRRYGTAFVPIALLVWLSNLGDRYVLAAFLGAGAAGQYLAAFSLASNGFLLANGVMSDLFRPMLFDAENTGAPALADRIFAVWLVIYAIICVVALAAIALFGGWIVKLLLAEAYRDGAVEVMLWVGKTSRDIEQDLTARLGAKYLQSPQVTVYVREYNSRRVTIEGSVKKPGVYPIRGKTTLVQFIAIAEGPSDVADTSSIVVFRNVNGKRSAARFDLETIRNGSTEDPVIQDGDLIIVNDSMAKTTFQNIVKVLPLTNIFIPLL